MRRPIHSLFKLLACFIAGLLACALALRLPARATIQSPLSLPGVRLDWTPDTSGGYRFLVGGHLYGAHANAQSLYPASSFLANFHKLNNLDVDFMLSLGDIVRSSDSSHFKALKQSFRGLGFPIFNAPGNHDLADGLAYLHEFLLDEMSFQYQGDYFILLNTESLMDPVSYDLSRLFVEREAATLRSSGFQPRNVFVCSHRLFWSMVVPELAHADALANEPLAGKMDVGQATALYDALRTLGAGARMYWLAGDVGTEWSVPLLSEKVGDAHFIATGVGDGPDDRLLLVEVDSLGHARFEVLSLVGGTLPALEAHDLQWAKQYQAAHRAPSEFWGMLRSKKLWLAFVTGLFLGALVMVLVLRKRGKA